MGTINMAQLYGTTPVAQTVDSGEVDQGDASAASLGGLPIPTETHGPVVVWVTLVLLLVAARFLMEHYGEEG